MTTLGERINACARNARGGRFKALDRFKRVREKRARDRFSNGGFPERSEREPAQWCGKKNVNALCALYAEVSTVAFLAVVPVRPLDKL